MSGGSSASGPYFGLPLSVQFVGDTPVSVIDLQSQDNPDSVEYNQMKGVMEGEYGWGNGPPVIHVVQTMLSVTENPDPDCEWQCVPINIARLDYYTYDDNFDLIIFYTEELNVSSINKVEYIILGYDDEKFTFIQSINKGYCCDGAGQITNRLFDVNMKDNKIIVRKYNYNDV